MKYIAPFSPVVLDLYREDQNISLVMVLDEGNWNIINEINPEKLLLSKSGTWQDAFKGFNKLIAALCEEGWELDAQGYTMPLFVQEGSSDKEYHINLQRTATGWSTICLYGRRGRALATAEKVVDVSCSEAWDEFRSVVAGQIKKGYQFYVAGSEYQSGATAEKVQGLSIQLLTDAQNPALLLEDDNYWAQEKYDGERRPIVKSVSGILGTNKEGISVNLNKKFEIALSQIRDNFKIDCEDLGDKLAVFDITELNGEDVASLSFEQRYAKLTVLFSGVSTDALILSRVAKTSAEKQTLLNQLSSRLAEGMVFKQKDAPYTNGKNLNGTQQKFKFYAEASVIVLQKNDKRSVLMGVLDANGQTVAVGNVTIPANAVIPEAGSVIEVRYLYAYPGGALFLPTYKSPRPDQTQQSCTQDKLKYKSTYDYTQDVLSKVNAL